MLRNAERERVLLAGPTRSHPRQVVDQYVAHPVEVGDARMMFPPKQRTVRANPRVITSSQGSPILPAKAQSRAPNSTKGQPDPRLRRNGQTQASGR